MDALGRLQSMKEAQESPETKAEDDSSSLSPYQTPKCIHNSIVYGVAFTICFIAQLFSGLLHFPAEFQLRALTDFEQTRAPTCEIFDENIK